VPEDLTYYDNFTLPEMPEPNNNIIVIQTPATYYTIDGLDPANGGDNDDDDEAVDRPLLSKSTTRACLFYVIPTMSLICIFIFILETIAISKSDNNGFPQGMDEKDGATMTPEDYYTWISKRKNLQSRNSANDEDKLLTNNKSHIWTWIGASVLISSILMVLITKALLLLTKNCCCCATSVHESKMSVCTAVVAAATAATTKGKAQKEKKKKRCHYKNPLLMGSLLLSMVGTWLIVMDQVLLASGRPVVKPQSMVQGSVTSCTFKDPTDGKEYLTSCQITKKSSSEPCPILKTSCEQHICSHLVPNATNMRQPPTLDQSCYYPYPAGPPCVEDVVKCSDSFPLPTFVNERLIFWIIMGFMLAIFFGLIVLLYNMANFHLTVMKSLWSEGTDSRYYTTEQTGHPKPTWRKLMEETCCLWTTNMYLPYFQADWICMSCMNSEPVQAFVSDGEGDDVNVQTNRNPGAENDDGDGMSPDLLQNHHDDDDDEDPLSNTTASATSSDGLEQQNLNFWEGASVELSENAIPTTTRKEEEDTVKCQSNMKKSFVSKHWKSDQHLMDGRSTLTNNSIFYTRLSNLELISSGDEDVTISGRTYFNNSK